MSAQWIRPIASEGNHIFVTDGTWAFDHRGFMAADRLLAHHEPGWAAKIPGWKFELVKVDFDLLDTRVLNEKGMRGPEQYLHDPRPRAERYIQMMRDRNEIRRSKRNLLS